MAALMQNRAVAGILAGAGSGAMGASAAAGYVVRSNKSTRGNASHAVVTARFALCLRKKSLPGNQ
jgi:hypothetical protein